MHTHTHRQTGIADQHMHPELLQELLVLLCFPRVNRVRSPCRSFECHTPHHGRIFAPLRFRGGQVPELLCCSRIRLGT